MKRVIKDEQYSTTINLDSVDFDDHPFIGIKDDNGKRFVTRNVEETEYYSVDVIDMEEVVCEDTLKELLEFYLDRKDSVYIFDNFKELAEWLMT